MLEWFLHERVARSVQLDRNGHGIRARATLIGGTIAASGPTVADALTRLMDDLKKGERG